MKDSKFLYGIPVLAAVICLFTMAFLSGPFLYIVLAVVLVAASVGMACLADDLEILSLFVFSEGILFGSLLLLNALGRVRNVAFGGIVFALVFSIVFPLIFAGIRALYGRNVERNGFSSYFIDQARFVSVFYAVFLVWWFGFFNVQYVAEGRKYQFMPLGTFASYIEAVIVGTISGKIMFLYLVYTIGIFVPMGFLITRVLEGTHILVRIAVIAIVPLLGEIFQVVTSKNRFDIDDIIFGFVGAVVGMLIYIGFNRLFLNVCGRGMSGKAKRFGFE